MDRVRPSREPPLTTVRIHGIAAGGEGVGRLEGGLTVFVPRTAPGDVVEIDLTDERRRYARGRLSSVHTASPERDEPACAHFRNDRCGGCQLQHLSPEAQLAAKQRIVADALTRIGHREIDLPQIVPSPDPWRYRTKITLAARGGAIGLRRFDDPDTVFDLRDCPIVREPVMALWGRVSRHRELLPAALDSLVLREDRGGGLHVIAGSRAPAWDAGPLARAVGEDAVSYWLAPPRGGARVVAGSDPRFPALAFEQVNPVFASRIRRAAVEALGDVSGQTVWDLFGGVGDTADLLAERGARVWTVEMDRRAVNWARTRDRTAGRGTDDITRVVGRVEQCLHRLPDPSAVVANPPRGGLHASVAARLEHWAQNTQARLAYVSCDPATLARDLARMPAFRVVSLVVYDLFPQTAHVETVAFLRSP